MELLELEAHAVELKGAAGGIVDLHRVAVVDQRLATRLIVELQGARSAFTRPERLTGDWLLPAHWPYSGVRLAHFAGPASPLYSQCVVAAKAAGQSSRAPASRDFFIMHPYPD